MKNKIINIFTISAILIIVISGFSGCVQQEEKTIKVSGAFAMYPIMCIWAEEYQKINSDIKIDVSSGGAGKGMSDALGGLVNIGMISRDIDPDEISQGVFWVSVVKDAVVATINSQNPVIDIILEKGLTKEQLKEIFITGKITTWGQLVNTDNNDPIHVYTRSDSCGAAETWAKYLGNYTQDDFTDKASKVKDDPGVAGAVKNDKYGIGYNNINYVYSSETKLPFEGLQSVPLDLNGNGILDENENFYNTRGDILNAISNDIYPSPPSRYLHLATKGKFTGITYDFVYWILTDGQKFVNDAGYTVLSQEVINQQLQYLESGTRPEIR
ncbi:MAG: substrate-binding domain-containing protein [Candidatus Thermoplasmatota archaeon]|nr:substrate-binding domain-containing protein [Candidatus Thermoplasmatota archaeon]